MSRSIQHSAATVEHYSPPEIADAARAFMGSIDLDPFSCEVANRLVRADHFFTKRENGFRRTWQKNIGHRGTAFVNPPGGTWHGMSMQLLGWHTLMSERLNEHIRSAVFVCFNMNLLQMAQEKAAQTPLDFPICYPKDRIHYWTNQLRGPTEKNPNRKPTRKQLEDFARFGACQGSAPPHSSCIVGVGGDERAFYAAFSPIGRVVFPRGPIG